MSERRWLRLATAALAACVLGCPPDRCPPGRFCALVASGTDAGPLTACLPGAWRAYGDGGSCFPIPCRTDGGGPGECGQADCVQQSFTVFVPGATASSGRMFGGGYISSATAGTWTNLIRPEEWSYGIEGAQLITDGGSGPRSQPVTCTAQELVLGEIALKVRLTENEAAALRALVLDGGTWVSLPHP